MIEFTNPNPVDALHTVLLITQYLCIPIVTIFVFLRLGIRLYYKQNIGVEDCTCRCVWHRVPCANVCRFLLCCVVSVHGLLRHLDSGYVLSFLKGSPPWKEVTNCLQWHRKAADTIYGIFPTARQLNS